MFPDRLGLSYMHSPARRGVVPQPQVAHPDFPFDEAETEDLSQVSTIVAGQHPASLWILPGSHKIMTEFWTGQCRDDEVAMQRAITSLSKVKPVLLRFEPNSRIIFHKHLLHGGPAKGRLRVHEYWGGAAKSQSHPDLTNLAVPLIGIDQRLANAVQPFGSP